MKKLLLLSMLVLSALVGCEKEDSVVLPKYPIDPFTYPSEFKRNTFHVIPPDGKTERWILIQSWTGSDWEVTASKDTMRFEEQEIHSQYYFPYMERYCIIGGKYYYFIQNSDYINLDSYPTRFYHNGTDETRSKLIMCTDPPGDFAKPLIKRYSNIDYIE